MTYVFSCPRCGLMSEVPNRDERACGPCFLDGEIVNLKRDYRAENAGIAVGNLKKEREHSKEEYAQKFLPTNSDFASASDPEGKKGMEKWRNEHTPAETNKKPYWPGEVEKKTW